MKWQVISTAAEKSQHDKYFYNTFARELEKFYDKIMNLVGRRVDAAEILTVAAMMEKYKIKRQ